MQGGARSTHLRRHVVIGKHRVDAAQHTGHVAVNVEQTQGLTRASERERKTE